MDVRSPTDYGNCKYLESEFRGMWNEVWKEHPGNSKGKAGVGTPKQEAKRCSELYKHAKATNLSFVVLGGTHIREDNSLMNNLGTIATNPVMSKKKVKAILVNAFPDETGQKINKMTTEHLTKGAVLNEGNWFILPNDMVMLGIVHSGKECHIATSGGKIPKEGTLWDAKNQRPRVLGRELLQLYNSGYRIVRESLNNKGLVMMRVDKEQAEGTGLRQIRGSLQDSSYEAIQRIFIDTVRFRDTEKGKAMVY